MESQYLSYCNWFISLSVMSSKFIHVGACVRTSSLFKASNISLQACVTFYLFIDGHLGDFHLLSTVNDVPLIMGMQISFCILSFNSFEYIAISGIDGSHGILFLIF